MDKSHTHLFAHSFTNASAYRNADLCAKKRGRVKVFQRCLKGQRVAGVIFGMLLLWMATFSKAWPKDEEITLPVIIADYYAWAYTEAVEDKATLYACSTGAVDAAGWVFLAAKPDYTGLFLVNLAGGAKTVYPLAVLLTSSDNGARERAWIALGTHAATLITLELLGKPEISLQAMTPKGKGLGLQLACRY